MKLFLGFLFALSITTFGLAQSQELSELEKAKIQIINLQSALAKSQYNESQLTATLGQCQAKENASYLTTQTQSLKQAIESTRPGFTFNLETGKFEPIKESQEDGPIKRKQQ